MYNTSLMNTSVHYAVCVHVLVHAMCVCVCHNLLLLASCILPQLAADQEKNTSKNETEKLWGTPVQYGTTMIQVCGCVWCGGREREGVCVVWRRERKGLCGEGIYSPCVCMCL